MQRYDDTQASCTASLGCKEWEGVLGDCDTQETQNGKGVNWLCPDCGKLVGTANY